MRRIGILSDQACQFFKPDSQNENCVRFIDQKVQIPGLGVKELRSLRLSMFPKWIPPHSAPFLLPVDPDKLSYQILQYANELDDMFLIMASRELNPVFMQIEEILKKQKGRADLHLIDSQIISVGEGYLVTKTLSLILQGIPAALIDEIIRETIPNIYMLLSTPNFSYLNAAGVIDIGQATAGELLSFLPIFSLEKGQLTPIDKMKNLRSLTEYFIEFIDEYDNPEIIIFLHPHLQALSETRLIQQHITENFPETDFYENTLSPFVASLVGPQGLGLVIIDRLLT